MSGAAMKLFMQNQLIKKTPTISPWINLHALLNAKYFTYIDLALAEELLQSASPENEGAAALICHLSAAARQGHLCIEINTSHVIPKPSELLQANRNEENPDATDEVDCQAVLENIDDLIRQGIAQLPVRLITELNTESHPKALQTPLCKVNDRFYFHRYWFYETLFIQQCKRLENLAPTITFDIHTMNAKLNELQSQNKLLKEQAAAIFQSSQNVLTMITGGPGTGKTYTAGMLVNIFLSSLPPEKRATFEIALAAPTGKAAANLQKSLLKAINGNESALLQAKTLHSLLSIRGSDAPSDPLIPLAADLVIVDESSMIDVRLMAYLFAAIKPGARLILLGDPLQLPAVESGSVFADLITSAEHIRYSAAVELKTCLRAELKGIIDFAMAVKEGDSATCLKFLDESNDDIGVHRLNIDKSNINEVCHHALAYYQTSLETPEILLNHFERFRILSAFRKGPYGVEAVNQKILKEIRRNWPLKTPFIAPIILLRTDPRLQLFNGETGVLVRSSPFNSSSGNADLSQGDYALFPAQDESVGIRKIPALLLPSFEFAFCLSVHKSQGSEFDKVLLLLPEGSEAFGREVLYTAITRARKGLELWDQPGVLKKTIARQNQRLSGIYDRLKSNCEKSLALATS